MPGTIHQKPSVERRSGGTLTSLYIQKARANEMECLIGRHIIQVVTFLTLQEFETRGTKWPLFITIALILVRSAYALLLVITSITYILVRIQTLDNPSSSLPEVRL